ncbi:MAG TPA: AAA family ATPase, partial [Treponemataceae bacterium]|nr:AAA family ATPase [Treponemataceae bacterium]
MDAKFDDLTPKQIVEKLDIYIIGQKKAKKSVAIALRNRTRRLKLSEDIREEIAPKNILMIGPTGVGKTEIARRLAKLCNAPFLKIEATKYTEVGYVGRDVESMVRDLTAVGYSMVKLEMQEAMKVNAQDKVEEALLDLLLPGSGKKKDSQKSANQAMLPLTIFGTDAAKAVEIDGTQPEPAAPHGEDMAVTREKFRQWLKEGKLEEKQVEVTVQKQQKMPAMEIFAGGNM